MNLLIVHQNLKKTNRLILTPPRRFFKLRTTNPHPTKNASKKSTQFLVLSLSFFGFILIALNLKPDPEPLLGDLHYHADFKVYLNGTPYDFAQEKYMSEEEGPLSPFTHLHDMEGDVIHKHMSGITLGDFFESIGMDLTETCFTVDDGTSYCNDDTHALKFYVNGRLNTKFDQYEIQDLDQILISYGAETEDELQAQLKSLTDEACIYSETCPERGSPPDESSCTGSSEDCAAPLLIQ